MLRRAKRSLKRLADVDDSDSSLAMCHSESERIRMTDHNASLEATVFGGENRITEQLENFETVTSGFKVSSVIGMLCISHTSLFPE